VSFLAHAEHVHPGFPQTRGEPGEVAVARHDAETFHILRVEDVHRVDDERRVGGVFAGGIAVLLDRDDRVV